MLHAHRPLTLLVSIPLSLFAWCPAYCQRIHYVDREATGFNDGTSWTNAFRQVQPAIDAASGLDQIRVANGTYAGPFVMRGSLQLMGGHAGISHSMPDTRDFVAQRTILDGGQHVVTVSDATPAALIEGFTIQRGLAPRTVGGGGIFAYGGGAHFRDCVIELNGVEGGVQNAQQNNNDINGGNGGGVWAINAKLRFERCTIQQNGSGFGGWYREVIGGRGGNGGAVHAQNSNLDLRNCRILSNVAGSGGRGNPVVTTGGSGGDGGAIYVVGGSLILVECEISSNRSGSGAYAGLSWQGFGGGHGGNGGGIYDSGSVLTMHDCLFTDNTSGTGSDAWSNGSTSTGGQGGRGGAAFIEAQAEIIGCVFTGNRTGSGGSGRADCSVCFATGGNGGNGAALYGGLRVINCTFTGNTAGNGGNAQSGSPSPDHEFPGAGGSGGGMYNGGTAINCLFYGNSSGTPGCCDEMGNPGAAGTSAAWHGQTLVNCTVFSNVGARPVVATVRNSIIWDNSMPPTNIVATYSDIQGGLSGEGNINIDPRFQTDGIHLRPDSPCIDAARNSDFPADIYTDRDGNPRFVDNPSRPDTGAGTPPLIDMGAFEQFALVDCNTNGTLDSRDLGPRRPTFATPSIFAVGPLPWASVAAQLDTQPWVDIATVSSNAGSVGLLFGTADGFVAGGQAAAGGTPISIAAGDLDGDGDIDLVTANYSGRSLSVLLNSGQSSFQVAQTLPLEGSPADVLIAELNGDDAPDLAAAMYTTNGVRVLTNNGAGNFGQSTFVATGQRPRSLIAARFDGNDSMDLAVLHEETNGVRLLLNNGQASFALAGSTLQTGQLPQSLACADLNLDGQPDLVASNHYTHDVSIFMNLGNLMFATVPRIPIARNPNGLAAVELNRDGYPDLAIACGFAGVVSLLVNQRNGSFVTGGTLPTGDYPIDVAPLDVDMDGVSDLCVTDYSTSTVLVFRNATPPPRGDCSANGVPDECDPRGDLSGDGIVGPADVAPFVTRLLASDQQCIELLDFNGDALIDGADVAGFVMRLIP